MVLEVSHPLVLLAAVVGMIIGALWYSPDMFAKRWMKLIGLTKKDMEKSKKKGMGKLYLTSFISTYIMAYVLAVFISMTGSSGYVGGIIVGLWAWAGFVAVVMLGNVIWKNQSVNLFILESGHYLTVLVAMGAILGL